MPHKRAPKMQDCGGSPEGDAEGHGFDMSVIAAKLARDKAKTSSKNVHTIETTAAVTKKKCSHVLQGIGNAHEKRRCAASERA